MRNYLGWIALLLGGCLSTDPDGFRRKSDGFEAPGPQGREGYYPVNGSYVKIRYEERNQRAMIGDILLYDTLLEDVFPSDRALALEKRHGVGTGNFWPSRYISFYVDGLSYNEYAGVLSAISMYNSQTNLVFTEVFSPPPSGPYIRFIPSTIHASQVGYVGSGAHIVELAPGAVAGTVLHELGHRLGLWHEHQRPDRDLYLQMNYENWCGHPDRLNIDKRAKGGGFCADWSTNMGIIPNSASYGPMDFTSTMMYWHGAWHLTDSSGIMLDQPAANSPYAGPNFANHARREGYAYPTMLRREFDYATDDRAWNWVGFENGTLSGQDVATLNSMYPVSPTRIGWIDQGSCSETILTLVQEDENTSNGTQSYYKEAFGDSWGTYGDQKGIYPYMANTTNINICPQTRSSLPVLREDYAVLKLSGDCPLNSFTFSRTADNENTTNANSASGDISPSSTFTGGYYSGMTQLEFCFVPGDKAVNSNPAPEPPWVELSAGAFTKGNFQDQEGNGCYYQWHIQDDEDTDNAFVWGDPYTFSDAAVPFVNRIMELFNNSVTETHYNWHACR